jgi:small subunit ribosomal protein S20
MPNKRNAEKALRQNKKRALLNKNRKDAYKDAIKKALKAPGADKKEHLRQAQKALDKAAKAGVIKKNTAARKLSRLIKKANRPVVA